MQQHLFELIPCDKLDLLTKEEVAEVAKAYLDVIHQQQAIIEKQNKELCKTEQKSFLLSEQVINIKNKFFGKSSERSDRTPVTSKKRKEPRQRVLLPSERYPNVNIIEKRVELDKLPVCPCCSKEMKDSGLTEDSEYLTVIPKRYYVVQQKRVKYRCPTCQEGLVTAPAIPRIKSGSSYSDEMVIDVALSKYCDLIPVERYVDMASRGGVSGLPANTLIQGTHNLADFLAPIYNKIKEEILNSKILHADETPHRMLEGDKKDHWYLWGFSTERASYFETHDTRSGSVASKIIKDSKCEYLVSDVFSGYSKAVSDSNIYRRENNLPEIKNIYCNSHARRKFKESSQSFEQESRYFLWCYQKIYHLEKQKDFKDRRTWQRLYYRAMERYGLELKSNYSAKSSIVQAINYLLNNFTELTFFLNFEDIPIDNNAQERLMRNPVIGRKTWYGTHSPRGAETNAILFSLVESCKINKVNPREYFKDIVHTIHEKRPVFTPYEYGQSKLEKNA
ncbi:MAG: IS66 family transposase [Alphaproteobacteria bacterium]